MLTSSPCNGFVVRLPTFQRGYASAEVESRVPCRIARRCGQLLAKAISPRTQGEYAAQPQKCSSSLYRLFVQRWSHGLQITFSRYCKSIRQSCFVQLQQFGCKAPLQYPFTLFQYLAHSGYKETDLSLKMMPIVKVSASARIPTTLDLSQIESILASVDRESPQGKRDYAVLMIAVKLGIRTSDIRNLRPANFNWEQHLVSFTQVKTGEPITLPLPTDVGWAVIDYLKNGRPVSDAPEIFLRAVAPYVSLQNFDNILIKHMRKAGIPLDSIKHHGLHSLRHSLATHMLDEGIPITSIQGVLGHINADSTQKYIGVNVRQLRSCALEVTD